ncbi:MAG TPA: hypothetical protein PKZ25_10660 [Candidatus Hydrogenedentes bacterium]|nr:hypothetical protein [Candidatus Hydrogenedentota bacterium]HQK76649.1 hypothetical protein [Candidatus Hydrogenedentota bacterium]
MKRALIAVLAGFLLASAGCQTNPFQKQPPAPPADLQFESTDGRVSSSPTVPSDGLPMATQQRFSDVPLPEKLKEDSERTFVYEAPGLQIGRTVYTIRAKPAELAQFYVRECPTAGWKLDSIVQADVITINFTKPDKKLRVTITDLGIGRGTELVLLIVPEKTAS